VGLAWEAIRVARVTNEVEGVSIPAIREALRQDPDNADLVHRLGLIYTYDSTNMNLSESVRYLRKAVDLNPRRWDFWADLGTTCDFVGDTRCSDEAFERAWALNLMTPALQWSMGNHYLLTNRPEKAFASFRRLLDLDPQHYFYPTVQLCLRATRDPQAIYAEVVPQGKDASVRFAFLTFLNSIADYESAMRIWGQMISGLDRSPNLSMVRPFLDFLIDHNQIQDAATVWKDLQHAGVIPPAPDAQAANLLYDGSFEGTPLGMGFDWRPNDSSDLVFDFSAPSAYQGAKCLRIDFAVGRNADYNLLSQLVPITPNTRYRLTAYVRSANLTSESGPRLRVDEVGCGDCGIRASDPTVGTTSWHPIEVEFFTRPQTQAVKISFWRPQDQIAHRDITGTVWLDDVTLRHVAAPGSDVKQERTR
jgi:tetratricopeptide (TPR) repeat protein